MERIYQFLMYLKVPIVVHFDSPYHQRNSDRPQIETILLLRKLDSK